MRANVLLVVVEDVETKGMMGGRKRKRPNAEDFTSTKDKKTNCSFHGNSWWEEPELPVLSYHST